MPIGKEFGAPCTCRDTADDHSLHFLKTRFREAEAWQLSATGTKDFQTPEGIRVAPALELLKTLV